jgi:hypothetical protein
MLHQICVLTLDPNVTERTLYKRNELCKLNGLLRRLQFTKETCARNPEIRCAFVLVGRLSEHNYMLSVNARYFQSLQYQWQNQEQDGRTSSGGTYHRSRNKRMEARRAGDREKRKRLLRDAKTQKRM